MISWYGPQRNIHVDLTESSTLSSNSIHTLSLCRIYWQGNPIRIYACQFWDQWEYDVSYLKGKCINCESTHSKSHFIPCLAMLCYSIICFHRLKKGQVVKFYTGKVQNWVHIVTRVHSSIVLLSFTTIAAVDFFFLNFQLFKLSDHEICR